MTNIAKLLKDAPKGMKLYSPICGSCELSVILYDNGIRVIAHDIPFRFDKYGRFCSADDAECLLFPSKDCRTWEGWKLPVEPRLKVDDWVVIDNCHNSTYQVDSVGEYEYMLKHTHGGLMPFPLSSETRLRLWTIQDAIDGDVLATDNGWTCIFKAFDGWTFGSYCFMDSQSWFCEFGSEVHTPNSRINGNIHPATKEQRDLLFKKMKEAGYEWDADKKELKKIQPHYDIKNFHAGMPVLVRDNNNDDWTYTLFSHYNSNRSEYKFAASGDVFCQCIPFTDGTKHLLGTIDKCPEEYINW